MRAFSVLVAVSFFACGSAHPSSPPPVDLDRAPDVGTTNPAAPSDAPLASSSSASPVEPGATGSVLAPAASAATPAPAPPLDLVDATLPPALLDAATQVRAGAWRKAKTALEAAIPTIESGGTPDDVAAAHALLARTKAALGDAAGARKSWATALAAADAADAVVKADADEPRRNLRFARLALVRAEALFAAAEEKRLAAMKNKVPVYRGSGKTADVNAFVTQKVGPWIQERMRANDEAERAYAKVLAVQPFAPPAWVVASGERVGAMYDALVNELTAMPTPSEWKGEGELFGVKKSEIRATFTDALDQALQPFRERARGAYRACSEQGRRFSVSTPAVAACDAWLAKHPAPNP